MRWHVEDLFQKYWKVTVVKLNLFPVCVTWERQRAFLMCPAASLPPCSVCHFVRPHKDATRSCVQVKGKGIGCLMDIPEAKSSAPECFCFISRCLKFVGWVDYKALDSATFFFFRNEVSRGANSRGGGFSCAFTQWCLECHCVFGCFRCFSIGTSLDPGARLSTLLQGCDPNKHMFTYFPDGFACPFSVEFLLPSLFQPFLVSYFLIPNIFCL